MFPLAVVFCESAQGMYQQINFCKFKTI